MLVITEIPRINWRAHSAPWRACIEMIGRPCGENGLKVARIVIEDQVVGTMAQPTATIDADAAQVLMDDLWHCGIRPTESAGTAGSMRAVERHLDDMRKIAFHKLSIK